jgi:serine/threonine-protein kinase RsbW
VVAVATPAWVLQGAWTLELPFRASSVRQARSALDAALRRCRVPFARRADAVVVLSELLANSLRHARPLTGNRLGVRWRVTERAIELAVGDAGSTSEPRALRGRRSAQSGRGLAIVQALALDWGVEGAHSDRQVVWALLAADTLDDRDS